MLTKDDFEIEYASGLHWVVALTPEAAAAVERAGYMGHGRKFPFGDRDNPPLVIKKLTEGTENA